MTSRSIRQIMEDSGRTKPRGYCPVCLRDVALTKSGRLYRHERFVPQGVCPGTGQLSQEVEQR